MGEVFLAEYGRAKTINFDLFEIDGVDFRVDAAHASADTKIMKDEGNEANTSNGFTDEGQGYSLVLTATEMQAARVTVYVVDQSTKVWLDKKIVIETYGHASSAHPNMTPYWTNGAVNGTAATTTVFISDGFTEATDDHLIGGLLQFTSGANLGQSREIRDYDDTTGTQTITLSEALLAAPADNDEFVITARPSATGYLADAIHDEVLTGATHNVVNSHGRRVRQIQEAGGYTGSAIYIDTVNGADGTTDFENGVDSNPVKSIGDANTLAASLGISRFVIALGSSITFAAAQDNQDFTGNLWTLALGSQSISGSHIAGAKVSGTATSATEAHFEHCEMGDCTLGKAHVEECDLEGTLTLSAAESYLVTDCHHSGTPIIDFGSGVANTTVHMHGYNGAVTIQNMGQNGTDVLHFDSSGGKLTLDNTNIGGTVNLNGTFELVNSGSNQTINRGGMTQDLVEDALDVTIADSTVADGSRPTVRQALLMLTRFLMERSISSTTMTIFKEDGTTSVMTLTLDDATNPTSITRAT